MLNKMKYLIREIFDDWLTRLAGIIFVLILILVAINATSNLYETHPVLGLAAFSFVPVLFIAGGIIFILAILKSSE